MFFHYQMRNPEITFKNSIFPQFTNSKLLISKSEQLQPELSLTAIKLQSPNNTICIMIHNHDSQYNHGTLLYIMYIVLADVFSKPDCCFMNLFKNKHLETCLMFVLVCLLKFILISVTYAWALTHSSVFLSWMSSRKSFTLSSKSSTALPVTLTPEQHINTTIVNVTVLSDTHLIAHLNCKQYSVYRTVCHTLLNDIRDPSPQMWMENWASKCKIWGSGKAIYIVNLTGLLVTLLHGLEINAINLTDCPSHSQPDWK